MKLANSKFVCLVILDGWGIAAPGPGNAISQANTINMNRFWVSYPHTQLTSSGEAVGLPRSEAGNTETGHLNIGAGRIVYQDLKRINMSIANRTFFQNPSLLGAIDHVRKNKSNLHIMGLIGASGIHSDMEHLTALLELTGKSDLLNNVFLHLFTDGRDSPPTSASEYIKKVREDIQREKVGQIASIMGRYWAMDRDRRWERTEKAYLALTKGQGQLVKTPEEAIDMSYKEGKTDEFIEPSVITDANGIPLTTIKENDAIIFFNFRIDRPRQLTASFVVDDFSNQSIFLDFDPYLEKYEKTHLAERVKKRENVFERGPKLKNLYFVTMTEYSKSLLEAGTHAAFLPEHVDLPLGKVISDAGLKQLRIAESEKERFVTYYFNGLKEEPFIGEERIIIPSQKIATYDLKPEMSAYEITEAFLSKLKQPVEYSFILVNFANPDMVAHTGSIGPTVKACTILDECLGKIANTILTLDGTLLISADHGNAEEMIDPQTGQIGTEHNGNPVPFIAISKELLGRAQTLQSGILADIAPTVLDILGIQKPNAMTERSLLSNL
ncbi:MAG: 2,3-bisphosphoglycerate-independent phosphoglycerate mutase [Patescibacteria group bacterium]